jgi:lipopolysaccharide/colanic/teichoic acid biosynthesis glycosyltransferase
MVPVEAAHSSVLPITEMDFATDCGRTAPDTQPFLLNSTSCNDVGDLTQGLHLVVRTVPGPAFRLLDVTIATLILIVVLPLMSICVLAVRLSGPGPVIFRQTRIGLNGREFTCLKFRTMIDRAEIAIDQILAENSCSLAEWCSVQKLRKDPRVTPLGSLMRRYCLDELPQLFNVLRGEMSIVGPRPIVADEISRYGRYFADYCSVKPGLTGLWQVSGLHDLPYSERVRLDSEYAFSKSLQQDLWILWRTVPIVLSGRNG